CAYSTKLVEPAQAYDTAHPQHAAAGPAAPVLAAIRCRAGERLHCRPADRRRADARAGPQRVARLSRDELHPRTESHGRPAEHLPRHRRSQRARRRGRPACPCTALAAGRRARSRGLHRRRNREAGRRHQVLGPPVPRSSRLAVGRSSKSLEKVVRSSPAHLTGGSRMRTLALVGATLSLVSLLVSPGFAQQVRSLTAAERAGIALARLGARQRVRIRVEGERLIEGSVELASPSLVVLRVDGSPERIPATAVDSLWVHATHWRRGALIGGAIGGIGLGAIAACPVQ